MFKNIKYITSIVALAVIFMSQGLFLSKVSAAVHSTGSNIINDGTIYLVTSDGKRRPYSSEATFLSYQFNSWTGIVPATVEDLALTEGSLVPPREGGVICSTGSTDKGTCYVITDSKKAGFVSEDVFTKLGFSFERVLFGDVSFLESAAIISNTTETHRPGTVIHINGVNYLIGKNGLMEFPSAEVLNSWGYTEQDLVNANQKDLELPKRIVLEARGITELRPYEPVIPTALELTNEQKFSIPFAGPNIPTMTEGWLYSAEEKAVHGFTNHGAVDFAAPTGTPVYAVADGYAVSSTHFSLLARTHNDKTPVGFGLGEFVQIWHPEQNVYSSYSHLSKVSPEIPYFKPKCSKEGACDPEVIYSSTKFIIKNGEHIKRGDLVGFVGDTGLSLGYKEKPRGTRPSVKKYPSWDETHLHFEIYTRDTTNFYKSRRYDPFGIYGRQNQYTDSSYTANPSIWKVGANNKPEFAK